MAGVETMGFFQPKTGCILETVRDRVKLITNKKLHKPFHITWKSLTMDDIEESYYALCYALVRYCG